MDPTGFASLRILKVLTSGSAQPLLGAGTEDMTPRLFNLPIIVNRFVPAISGVLIDRNAVVAAVGPVQVSVSEHQFFSSDSIALRATWRIGWNIVRPSWVGKFSMTALGS